MKSHFSFKSVLTFENAIALAKLVAVVCAFMAFALSMRQKEFDRFNEIKPLFEVVSSNNAAQFGILNHGGIVYFAGCSNKGAGSVLASVHPRS